MGRLREELEVLKDRDLLDVIHVTVVHVTHVHVSLDVTDVNASRRRLGLEDRDGLGSNGRFAWGVHGQKVCFFRGRLSHGRGN
jgi:hypothetical protein